MPTQAADLLLANQHIILEKWEAQVAKRVPAAAVTQQLALRDHLPTLLQDIAKVLRRDRTPAQLEQDEKFEEIKQNSNDHGRHRASTIHYTVDQIIHEYIIFHRILTDMLKQHQANSPEVIDTLKYTLETAMLQSAAAFNKSLEEMQEKLVGMLAHDIRNPLANAQAALSLVRQSNTRAEEYTKLHALADRSLRRALRLTEELLDSVAAKAGEGLLMNFQEGTYNEELLAVYNDAQEVYAQTVRLNQQNEAVSGVFDGAALRRVLENLLTNAVKYGSRAQPIELGFKDAGSEVCFWVTNQGRPIPADKQESIFNFLTQDDSEAGGSSLNSWGMGLTLVKIVADAHHGRVTLQSSEEDGTTFRVHFNKKPAAPGRIRTRMNLPLPLTKQTAQE